MTLHSSDFQVTFNWQVGPNVQVEFLLWVQEEASFCTEVQNSFQRNPIHSLICHSGIGNLLHIILGQQLHQTLSIWNGGHLDIWIMFHCAAENLHSLFKDCEHLREVVWLKSINSLERRNIQVSWSRGGINWGQIWLCEYKAAVLVLPRKLSTFLISICIPIFWVILHV